MRSPPLCIEPKAARHPPQNEEKDSSSVTSTASSYKSSSSSRKSRLPRCTNRNSTSSYGAEHTYGIEGNANVRVVARIRPIIIDSMQENQPESEASRAVFAVENEIAEAPKVSFLSPTGAKTPTKSPMPANRSDSSVKSLTAKFNSPKNIPLMPSTDAVTKTPPPQLFSPSQAATPVHTNGNKIVPVRQSFIQSPSSTKEIEAKIEKRAAAQCKASHSILAGKYNFEFDAVIDSSASQEEVYETSLGGAVRRNIFRGFNTTVMAYGQKDSGKSHTMFGPKKKSYQPKYGIKDGDSNSDAASVQTADTSFSYNTTSGSHEQDGIVQRAVHDLFVARDKQATGGEVSVQMTFVEIYNDGISDLLSYKKSHEKQLVIRDEVDTDGKSAGTAIRGLTSIKLKSLSHAKHILSAALKRRKSASRSHTICTLNVIINPAVKSSVTSGKMASMTSTDIVSAKLTLVDLAGSERSAVTTAKKGSKEQREDAFIAKDLFVLGQCILGLAEKKGQSKSPSVKAKHIPYRDSKLTRILRDSLGGNSCTIMLACVAPCKKHLEGSLSTLRYAEQSRKITNHVKKNATKAMILTPAEGAALRRENKVLKSHVLDMTRKLQKFRKGNLFKPQIVFDLDNFQEGHSEEESLEAKRWRLKCEKLLTLCAEAKVSTEEAATLTEADEALLKSHSLEVKDLREQINQLLHCKFDDCVSMTSGLTMETGDFDERSVASGSVSVTSLQSNNSFKTCEEVEGKQAGKSHKEKMTKRQEKLKDLDNEISLKMAEKEKLHSQITEQEDVLRTISQEIQELRRKIDALRAEEADVCKEVQKERENLDSCKECIQGKEALCNRINTQIASLKAEVTSLTSEKYSLVEEVEGLQNISEVVSELTDEKEAKSKVEELLQKSANEAESLKSTCTELTTKLATQQTLTEAESQKTKIAEKKMETLQLQVKEMEAKLKEKEGRVKRDASKKELESRIAQLEGLVKEHREQKEPSQQKRAIAKPPLHDTTNDLSKPPLAKKRKNPSGGFPRSAKRMSMADSTDVSTISVSCLLKGYSNKCAEDANERSLQDFNASFDNHSLMSGTFSAGSGTDSLNSDERAIRLHAQKLLFWADKSIEKKEVDNKSTYTDGDKENFSNAEQGAFPTFLTPVKDNLRKDTEKKATPSPFNLCKKVNTTPSTVSSEQCTCKDSIFSRNKEQSEFFLPKLGLACNCGAAKKAQKRHRDPTSLKCFLRSWQVRYLRFIGIYTAGDLISRYERDAQEMASAMKYWRSSKKMKPARSKACLIALQIWTKTAKTVLRTNRKQTRSIQRSTNSRPTKPSFLEITVNDSDDVSTMSNEESSDESDDDFLLEGEYEV